MTRDWSAEENTNYHHTHQPCPHGCDCIMECEHRVKTTTTSSDGAAKVAASDSGGGSNGHNPHESQPSLEDPDFPLLKRVIINVCQPCLDGEKGECHYPGCIQWLKGDGERLDFEYRYEAASSNINKETNMQQQPSVGRIVPYVSYGAPIQADGTQEFESECRAAIITAVHEVDQVTGEELEDKWVSLCVMNPTGLNFVELVGWKESEHEGGTWHWPERV